MNYRDDTASFMTGKIDSIAVFVLSFSVYLWSLPRTVVLEDDGLFILAAYFNGIAHPPGYPLYTLLSHLATLFPVGSVAFRVHCLSALFAALACVCLYIIAMKLLKQRWLSLCVALVYACSNTFWSQAIIAEVYSLNVLLFLLLVVLVIRLSELPVDKVRDSKLVIVTGVVYGLGLSNHWPLLILSSPLLLALVLPVWRPLLSCWLKLILSVCIGLLPYLWLVARSNMNPEVSFYGPIESLDDFWFVISRAGYVSIDVNPAAGWLDKFQYMSFVLRQTIIQFGYPASVFILAGFVLQWRHWPLRVSTGLTLAYLGNTLLLIFLLQSEYALFSRNIFRVYPLIAYAVVALWLGLGLLKLFTGLQKYLADYSSRLLLPGVSIFMVAVSFMANAASNYRANDYWAELYAKTTLASLEKDAILFTAGDLDVGTLGYVNKILGFRKDVTLYNVQGLIYSNRLIRAHKTTREEWETRMASFIKDAGRPIYFIEEYKHPGANTFYGLYYGVDGAGTEDKTIYTSHPLIIDYFKQILAAGPPVDPWEYMHYWKLKANYCALMTGLEVFSNETSHDGTVSKKLREECNSYYGLMNIANILMQHDVRDWEYIDALLEGASTLKNQANTKGNLASWYNLKAHSYELRDDNDKARQYYEESIIIWKNRKNPAFAALEESG